MPEGQAGKRRRPSASGEPSAQTVDAIRRALLAWYKRHQRDLPWRHTEDPYAIWVCEVMLQQTQVRTAAPFYGRFLERFPTVQALAAAPQDDVLKVWEGLGYYARARNLHRAAQLIASEHGGRLPNTFDELARLPGIGRYTAGAIASMAFGRDEPVLDANVTRVLSRLFAVRGDPRKAPTRHRLWETARLLLPAGNAGRFNQALMDLGAIVCTARVPQCLSCPLSELCVAKRKGLETVLPKRAPRKSIPHVEVTAGLVWDRERSDPRARLLITKRCPEDMLGGLWEFPGGRRELGETLRACLARELKEELEIEVEVGEPFLTVKHAYSHFRITLSAFHCRITDGEPQAIACTEWRWVHPLKLGQYAFPRADLRIIERLMSGRSEAL